MRVIKQSERFPVENYDSIVGTGQRMQKHGPLLPNTIRCIISGPSNSGKTNIMFNLLGHPEWLVFENIYVFSKSLYQEKYQNLAKAIPKGVGYFAYDDNASVIAPDKARSNSIMIFDDVSCEKHDNIRLYFTMGRHKNIDSFYLAQTYSRVPKQLVRDNANLLILFKQDEMNLRHVFNDHVTPDMSFDKLKQLCALAWKEEEGHGFVVVAKDYPINKGRYRVGFDSFVELT